MAVDDAFSKVDFTIQELIADPKKIFIALASQ